MRLLNHLSALCLKTWSMGLLFLLLLGVRGAEASEFGRSGFSGNPTINRGATCSVCHSPGASAVPAVTLSGPTRVDAGTTHDYTVTIRGGPAQTAGIGLSVRDSAGELDPVDDELSRIGAELSHTGPKPFMGDEVAFSFRWTAPAYNADLALYATGNSSSGQRDLLGDGIGKTRLDVQVRNGSDPPPPPPPPPQASFTVAPFASGFNQPVAIAHAKDRRLFVVERAGRIRVIGPTGRVQAAPFLDIRNRVQASGVEQGLLGLAFHPDYRRNGFFYVHYTRGTGSGPDRSRVSRFRFSRNRNVADGNSEVVLLEFEQPFANHNGGDLHFGPDGYLYIASGDGGSRADPQNNGQRRDTLLGKILRIDVNNPPDVGNAPDCDISGGSRYRIPAGNAYNDGKGGEGCDEIYASGLRNPWRFSFDRETGDLWIGDVGQNAFEEVNFVPAGTASGLNFGWRCLEGDTPFNSEGCSGEYWAPIHVYSHADGNCSVTGGYVYRGTRLPALQGQYVFTDFCNSSLRTLSGSSDRPNVTTVLAAGNVGAPAAFGEDLNGELYIADFARGIVYRIQPAPVRPSN